MTNELIDEKPQNPPAFARQAYAGSNEPNTPYPHHEQEGMTLRDYFAAAALTGMISTAGAPCLDGLDEYEDMTAISAYKIADSMLKARFK